MLAVFRPAKSRAMDDKLRTKVLPQTAYCLGIGQIGVMSREPPDGPLRRPTRRGFDQVLPDQPCRTGDKREHLRNWIPQVIVTIQDRGGKECDAANSLSHSVPVIPQIELGPSLTIKSIRILPENTDTPIVLKIMDHVLRWLAVDYCA